MSNDQRFDVFGGVAVYDAQIAQSRRTVVLKWFFIQKSLTKAIIRLHLSDFSWLTAQFELN